ncbi:MAG: 3-deoxy-D-manno-octulosonic acid transferase [Rhodospirillales bacterium]|nr:3-deoxy-D-manno-octulosonic acid transferase [Rhodospirillales bacterium]
MRPHDRTPPCRAGRSGSIEPVSEFGLYRAATTLGGPLIRLHLARRRARGKEDPERFRERLGIASRPRPDGPLTWVHAASVGESLSLLPLIERLRERRPGASVLMTTGTVTSARLMEDRLPAGAIHQYAPVDRLRYVRRFLAHWRPDAALWAESEFWPNLITETAACGAAMILVQGRISPRSNARWRGHRPLIAHMLSRFAVSFAQSEIDAEHLQDLGARNVACLGNLKFSKPPLPVDDEELARMRGAIGARPCWLAASTHPGEDDIVARAHRHLQAALPNALCLIVPRHPERGAAIARQLSARGLTVTRRSAGEAITSATDVHVGDTIGELGLFYRLVSIAFIGKSLAGKAMARKSMAGGGQNPLEAAQLGCAVLFGPDMTNFAGVAAALEASGAAQTVLDDRMLATTVLALLQHDDDRARRAAAAIAVAAAEAGALDRVADAILPYLSPLSPPGAVPHARP